MMELCVLLKDHTVIIIKGKSVGEENWGREEEGPEPIELYHIINK